MATALVTGASAGIGSAFCDLLAKQGFDLVLVARDQSRLNAKAETLRAAYAISVEVLPADLSKPEQLLVIENRLGEPDRPIEVLINNAGFGIKDSFLIWKINSLMYWLELQCD
jgi:short-subunit dehydrogenase